MDNPYQTGAYGGTYPTATGQVSPAIIQSLAGTKPWVRLCSILGFIGSGIMILGGVMMLLGGAIGGISDPSVAGLAGFPIVMGLLYLVTSLLYLIPAIKLWKYGTAILRLMSSQSAADLEQALEQQRGFWKFVGIMVLITLGFFILAVVGGIAAAAIAAGMG